MVTRLTAELIEEYLGGNVVPRVSETHESGIVMVPAEYIKRLVNDLDPEGTRGAHSGTKAGWISTTQNRIKKMRGVSIWAESENLTKNWKQERNLPVELVPFNIERFWSLQNEIIEIIESKQTAEAMKWTFKASIARFMDETGLLPLDANAETKDNTRMNRSFERGTRIKYDWSSPEGGGRPTEVPGDVPTPSVALEKGSDTL
jgi:hypothetical protein